MSFRVVAAGIIGFTCAFASSTSAGSPQPGADTPMLADADPDNDFVVAPPEPILDCEAQLRAAGVDFSPAELPVKAGNAKHPTCGARQAVVYRRGPLKVRFSPAPVVSCGLALGLLRFESVLNQEAERYFGQSVVRVEQGGTYNCRKMARFDLVSEHAYANAIDIRGLTLKNGRKLSVLKGFGRIDAEASRPEAKFWRTVANRLYDEGAFSVVITPFFDALHRDHLHLDQARYRVDGSRYSG
jgi:hypothetical protein